ncbi:MAG: hypothetical protein MJE77_18510 [Proteobacteria bacterium]|nr:hypothetical protein [Pseudomonadota bacterium]
MNSGCNDERMGTYFGRLVSTLVMDHPVKNDTRMSDPAEIKLEKQGDRVRIALPGCSAVAERSDNVGLELIPGQTCQMDIDGTSTDFQLEGSGQVTEAGTITLIWIGRHASGEATWQFNGRHR